MDTQKNNEENIDLSRIFDEPVEKPEEKQDEQEELQDFEQIFSPSTSKMVKWLIKHSWGLIKTENSANFVLLILSIIMFGLSFILLYSQLTPKTNMSSGEFPPAELIEMDAPPTPN